MKLVYRRIIEICVIAAFVGLAGILPLYLISEKPTSIEINSDSDFIKYNFPGSGTSSNPYIIEDFSISKQLFRGISITNTHKYFVIRNCYLFQNLLDGIRIDSVAEGTGQIYNNTVQEHSQSGIFITNSQNITVRDNIIIECKYHIWLNNSNNCILTDNTIYAYRPPLDKQAIRYRGIFIDNSDHTRINNTYIKNVAYGIYLVDDNNSTISNNFLHVVTAAGLFVLYSNYTDIYLTTCLESYQDCFAFRYSNFNRLENSTAQAGLIGLRVYTSNYNEIKFNSFEESITGIRIYEQSNNNTINSNLVANNEEIGIEIQSGSNNKIYRNSFINNNESVEFQAEDNSVNNSWFDELTLEGNYWQGWNVSLPYPIQGSANNFDPYPLASPIMLILKHSIDKAFSEKTFNLEFFFKISDLKHERR